MPVIEISNYTGDARERLPEIAKALVAACVAAKLPGIDEKLVAVTCGGGSLLGDDTFLVIKVLLLPGASPKGSYAYDDIRRLLDGLAKAAGALLTPEWGVMVVADWHIKFHEPIARAKGSLVVPERGTLSVIVEGGMVDIPPPPDAHPDYLMGLEWLRHNLSKLHEKYRGQWVVVHRNAVVTSGSQESVQAHVHTHELEAVTLTWEIRDKTCL